MNALRMPMRRELREAVETLDADGKIRVIVLIGAGNQAFCAGGDIKGFMEAHPEQLKTLHEDIAAPARCAKPVIAAVRGYCFGAGLELSMACDLIIASESSTFALPEIRLGMIPGSGGSQRLVRRIGMARAKEMMMLGKRLDARQAADWGLVNTVVPDEEWENEVRKTALELASYSPLALRVLKQVANDAEESHLSAGMKMEGAAFSLLQSSKDFREGVEAYLEKRKPHFKGR